MGFCSLDRSNDNGFFVLTMSSSDDRQYLTEDAIRDLTNTLAAVRDDPNARGLVTTSESGSFCDGIDYGAGQPDQAAAHEGVREVIRLLLELPVPTVAAVGGDATSLGLALALAHDHIVVRDRAELRLPEAKLGRRLPTYVPALLRDKVSYARLRKLLMLMSEPCKGGDLPERPWWSAHASRGDMETVHDEAIELLYQHQIGAKTAGNGAATLNYVTARQALFAETCAAVGIAPRQRPRPSAQELASCSGNEQQQEEEPDNGSSPSNEGIQHNKAQKKARSRKLV